MLASCWPLSNSARRAPAGVGAHDTAVGAALAMAPTGDGSDAPERDAADPPTVRPRKLSIDYLMEGDSVRTNPHLRAFAASRLPEVLRSDPNYRSWASIKSKVLRKEIAEASAAANRIPPAVAKARGLDLALGDPLGDGDGVVIFDLCSGKGFTSILLAHRYPRARVLMLDNNKKINLAHLHSLHPRVTFHCVDLYAPEALEIVRDAVALHGSTAAAVVGVHLCGDLARRAMQLWDESRSDALVLSPCCLVREVGEHKRPAGRFGYGLSRLARTSGWDAYHLWCQFLFHHAGVAYGGDQSRRDDAKVASSNPAGRERDVDTVDDGRARRGTRRNLDWDEDMISERNAFLCVSRGEGTTCKPCEP